MNLNDMTFDVTPTRPVRHEGTMFRDGRVYCVTCNLFTCARATATVGGAR